MLTGFQKKDFNAIKLKNWYIAFRFKEFIIYEKAIDIYEILDTNLQFKMVPINIFTTLPEL